MSMTLVSIEELRSEISACINAAFIEFKEKVNADRLCKAVETRKILGGVSHSWLQQLGKAGLLKPQVGGGHGSVRLYKYADIIAYMNRPKKRG